jgi:hypothetical protein
MNDDELHQLLRQHPAKMSVPRDFQRDVWGRIESDQKRTVSALLGELLQRMLATLARPQFALATLVLFASAGLGLGLIQHEREVKSGSALVYQQAVNPLLRHGLKFSP